MIKHGNSAYTNGRCRCQRCRDAHADVVYEWRQRNADRLAANPDSQPHGLFRTYNDHGCRCTPCTTAARAHWRTTRANTR